MAQRKRNSHFLGCCISSFTRDFLWAKHRFVFRLTFQCFLTKHVFELWNQEKEFILWLNLKAFILWAQKIKTILWTHRVFFFGVHSEFAFSTLLSFCFFFWTTTTHQFVSWKNVHQFCNEFTSKTLPPKKEELVVFRK